MKFNMHLKKGFALWILVLTLFSACKEDLDDCDTVIHNGTVYNGTGEQPFTGTVAIKDQKIIYVGEHKDFEAQHTIDASGRAVSPGFILSLIHI